MQPNNPEIYLKTFSTEKYPEGVIIKPGKKLPPGSLQKMNGEINKGWHDFGKGELIKASTNEIEVIIIGQAYKMGNDWKLYELGEDYGLLAIMKENGLIVPKLRKAQQKERYAFMKRNGVAPASSKSQPITFFMDGETNNCWPILKKLWTDSETEVIEEVSEMLKVIEISGIDVSNPHLNLKDIEDKILQEQEDLAPESFIEDEYPELEFRE